MPEKLSQGPRANPDLSRSSSGLGRGPTRSNKLPASPLSGTWPAPGSTLDLDFANNRGWARGVGQGGAMDAITFTRAGSGTFVGPDGLLGTASSNQPRFDWASTVPLLQRNLFAYTEQLDNSYWTLARVSLSSPSSGTYLVTETTGNGPHTVTNQNLNFLSGQTYTLSIEAKQSTGTRNIRFSTNSAAIIDFSAVFDVTNGTVLSGAGASITPLGDGWYRCSVTRDVSSSGSTNVLPIQLVFGSSTFSYTGDGTSGVLFRYPQVELGSAATNYQTVGSAVPSTTPLAATTTSNGLLVEEAGTNRALWSRDATSGTGTNLLTFSDQFDNAAWLKTALSVPATNGAAPDATLTADTLREDTTNDTHVIRQTPSASASTAYIVSVYFKRDVGTRNAFIQINNNGSGTGGAIFAWFDLGAGTASAVTDLIAGFTSTSAEIVNAGSGWYRCVLRFTTVVGTTSFGLFYGVYNATRLYTGDGASSILAWGAQAVPGSTLTDYQPTTTTALFGWSRSNATVAKTQTGIDGVVNAATLVTATAANAVLIQPIVLASGSRTSSIYLKRVTGTGAVQCTIDGSTWSTVDVNTTEWRRITLFGTITNPCVGVRLLTSGDAVAFDYAQVEDGLFATSPILTTTATVTRAADVADLLGVNFSSWYNPKECTLSVESFSSYTYQAVVAYPTLLNTTPSMGATFVASDAAGSVWGLRTGTRSNFTIDSQIYFYSGTATDESATIFNIVPANRMVTKMSGSLLSGTSFSTSYFGLVAKAYDSSTQIGSRAALAANSLRIGSAFLFPFNGTVKRIVYYPKCYNDDIVRDLAL